MGVESGKDLNVYKAAYKLAMNIFEVTKNFPPENSETDSSLDFAKDCGYISPETHLELISARTEIGRMLGSMIRKPQPFIISERRDRPLVAAPRSDL
jgi:hypothetical protein